MSINGRLLRSTLWALLVSVLLVAPALAGSAVIGSVAGSLNATVGSESLLPNTTIFSGDTVQVRDGVAVITVGTDSRVIFGKDTVASFLRDAKEVTVTLNEGDLSVLHPVSGTPVRVKVGQLYITPAAGFKTLGEIAMLNGSLVVTAKEGELTVAGYGTNRSVTKGQTIVITPKTKQNTGGGGGGGNAGWGATGSTTLEIIGIAAAGTGAILAGVAMSRAGSANTAANNAVSAANAATSAANAANSTAAAAASAAAAANSSAQLAQFLAACANAFIQTGSSASITGPGGTSCPSYTH